MKSHGDRLVALILFVLSVLYGVSAMSIDVFPGREHELITSRTFPYGLAAVGALCALWILLSARPEIAPTTRQTTGPRLGFAWWRCLAVVIASIGYSFALERMGFMVSTGSFLVAASLLLGERRVGVLMATGLIVPIAFWLILDVGLDMRLPGFDP